MQKKSLTTQSGQLLLTLILVMSVALAIGLSVIQRSLIDVSTSSKVEQSSRAFSAAEAGIEQALLREDSAGDANLSFDNASLVTVHNTGLIPQVPLTANTRQDPLEYPPVVKEEIAHIWLADPNGASLTTGYYLGQTVDVYWGNSEGEVPAIELTFVYYNGTQYKAVKQYYDSPSITRSPANSFDKTGVECKNSGDWWLIGEEKYKCRVSAQTKDTSASSIPILGRMRLLYNDSSQPIAVWAVGTCGKDCSLPPQARRITSTGSSGESKRRVRLFQIDKVVPPYFDFAIFSVGEIKK